MPPDATHSTASPGVHPGRLAERVPPAWREPLFHLPLCALALMLVTAREWGEMLHQWWNIDTYQHILLVPLITVWLVRLKTEELAKITPRPFVWGLAAVVAGLGLWLLGRASGINLLAHAGAVGAVQGALVTIVGVRASLLLALPLAYLAFLVPFGDEIIPFLQAITAEMAIALTIWSGVPAVIDGIYIDTPAGLFIVAEECSGVKFLVAMVTLAVLVGFTRFHSWKRRALFLLAAIIVPILANGVRAWGTIYIAQFAGVEFASGFDHIFYGWIFFAIVVALVLAGAWRFFESEPEDYGFTAETLADNAIVARFERGQERSMTALVAIAALGMIASLASAFLTPLAGA